MDTRIHGKVVFECDGCAEVLETECTNFLEALVVLHEEGWSAAKNQGVWFHYCPNCRERH